MLIGTLQVDVTCFMTPNVKVTFVIGVTYFMDPRYHRVIRGRHDLLLEPKGQYDIWSQFDLVYDRKGHRVIRGRRDLLYDPKGHSDFCGRFDLVYETKMSKGY